MNKQTQEALKMAIEALEHAELVFYITKDDGSKVSIYAETVNACKEALEQPAQEPVAWMSQGGMLTTERLQAESWVSHGGKATPLYPHSTPDSTLDSTHPHQWQELTNEDIARLILINEVDGTGDVGLARLVEHASRIKNHG